jgi:hypothetical protein
MRAKAESKLAQTSSPSALNFFRANYNCSTNLRHSAETRFGGRDSGSARRDQGVKVGRNLSEGALGTGDDLGGPKTF